MASDTASAAEIQRALADEPWCTASPPRARIGLHTDEGVIFDGGYANRPINRLLAVDGGSG